MIARRPLILAPFFWASSCARAGRNKANAIRRGLEFIYRQASDPAQFAGYGPDFLWCFYSLAMAAADPGFRARGWEMGVACARRYRKLRPALPDSADAETILDFASGSYTADCLGFPDPSMKQAVESAARRFRPADLLGFDPSVGPPQEGIHYNLYGALVTAYGSELYGIWLGGRFDDIAQWIPRLRPYHPPDNRWSAEFDDIARVVTHIVYTFNDYNLYRLRPEWFRPEYELLRATTRSVIEAHDPENGGEFMDSLRAFGVPFDDPVMRLGVDYFLSTQNSDGSWGRPDSRDPYYRYHCTWTGIGALIDNAYRKGEGVTFPEALARVRDSSK